MKIVPLKTTPGQDSLEEAKVKEDEVWIENFLPNDLVYDKFFKALEQSARKVNINVEYNWPHASPH